MPYPLLKRWFGVRGRTGKLPNECTWVTPTLVLPAVLSAFWHIDSFDTVPGANVAFLESVTPDSRLTGDFVTKAAATSNLLNEIAGHPQQEKTTRVADLGYISARMMNASDEAS